MDLEVVVGLVVALVGAAGGVAGIVAWRRLPSDIRSAEIADDIAASAEMRNILAEYRIERAEYRAERERMAEEREEFRKEQEATSAKIAELEDRLSMLETWVRAQGVDPLHIYDGEFPS